MELAERRRLVEEVKRRGRHDRVECAVVEGQLLGWAAHPVHPIGSGAGLREHPVRHVYPVDGLGV